MRRKIRYWISGCKVNMLLLQLGCKVTLPPACRGSSRQAGQRIDKPVSGELYILNGRKYIAK